jgi:Na+/H+-dicarboxylate symporter
MLRTCLNVTGDLAVATAVAKWENEFDEQVFNSGHAFVHPDHADSKS